MNPYLFPDINLSEDEIERRYERAYEISEMQLADYYEQWEDVSDISNIDDDQDDDI